MGLTKAATKLKIQTLCIYGGESMKQQLAPVRRALFETYALWHSYFAPGTSETVKIGRMLNIFWLPS